MTVRDASLVQWKPAHAPFKHRRPTHDDGFPVPEKCKYRIRVKVKAPLSDIVEALPWEIGDNGEEDPAAHAAY
ncbi:hypothetical protein DTO027I6_9870 [Penicillium roqueforti]|nr:hypothetical protein CBS147337_10073 [Penicillium roqueforti]KAI3185015.1 hypothetical protein DTO027I6_9870 [Penicillium roqueforti]